MFYPPGITPHGLPHDPFKSCVLPRPIGWISTVDAQGWNKLAPYSQLQNVSFDPPMVMFSANPPNGPATTADTPSAKYRAQAGARKRPTKPAKTSQEKKK